MNKISENAIQSRRAMLRNAMAEAELDGVAIVPGPNFYYLTGLELHLMERPTIIFLLVDGTIKAVIPFLEKLQWSAAMPEAETEYWHDSDGFEDAIVRVAKGIEARRIGVEGQRMRVFEYDALISSFSAAEILNAESEIARIRLSKDADEVALMKKAVDISESALAKTIDQVEAGMSELKIKNLLKYSMLDEGAEGFAFDPIVLTGAKSANPHEHSSDNDALNSGDALLFDFGASFGGYHADITRTFFCRDGIEEFREIYETVLAANKHGRRIARPGMTAHELDEEVTGILRSSTFANMIVHKTGHGLGLDVHELPQVMVGNHASLDPGTVLTIEPGLYRAGTLGVRIEDDVLLTSEGARSLTEFPREFTVVG